MECNAPEPVGDFKWGNLVVDLLAGSDDLEALKNDIDQSVKKKLYLAYLWYQKYKDSPLDYLTDHDVSVDFYKSLFDDPTANQPSEPYLEHLLQHAIIGSDIPKYEPPLPDSCKDPFEEIDGRLYIHLKVDPPFPLISPLNDLGLPDKELYTTGDICRILDMHLDTFRYRLRSGIYPEPKQRAGDKRRFTKDEIKKIVQITSPT